MENNESGLPKQDECVSLCTWRKAVKKQRNALMVDDIECLGALLVDGEVRRMNESLYLRESESLRIYVDMARKEILWEFEGKRYFKCEIPQSILRSQEMYFFVALNNTNERIVIKNMEA